jgi:cytochrome c oxidase subunit 2
MASFAAQAADVAKGKTQFETVCGACHGMNGEGNATLNAPKLAGQEEWFLKRQLENFQQGIRGAHENDVFGMQMKPLAATLDAAAVADVAAYLTSLEWSSAAATLGGDLGKGKALFVTCQACHGASAEGNATLNAPRIGGQEDWYLVRQLKNFAAGIRGSHPQDVYGMQMKPIVATLPDDAAIHDVSVYINSIQ